MNTAVQVELPFNAMSATHSIAIEAVNISYSVHNKPLLHGINARFQAGRWTSIVGPNGAGKTTLLKVLAGLLHAKGEVKYMSEALQTIAPRQRAQKIAWLGQNEHGAEDMLVHDVVMLGRMPHIAWFGSAGEQDFQAVEHALRTTHAWDWRNRTLSQLSSGERQRVLLARAMAVQAETVLMDEPLMNLDPPHQADWLRWAKRSVAQGKTVISVLHEISLALQADDMLVMANGQLMHQGACDALQTHAALEQVFDQAIQVVAVDKMRTAHLNIKQNSEQLKQG